MDKKKKRIFLMLFPDLLQVAAVSVDDNRKRGVFIGRRIALAGVVHQPQQDVDAFGPQNLEGRE